MRWTSRLGMATVKLYHIVWLAGWLVGSLVGWLDGLSISVHTRKHILCSANSPRTSNSNINRWSQQTSSSTISYIGGIAFPIFISLFGQIHIWECNTTTNIYASFLAFHCNTYFNFFFFFALFRTFWVSRQHNSLQSHTNEYVFFSTCYVSHSHTWMMFSIIWIHVFSFAIPFSWMMGIKLFFFCTMRMKCHSVGNWFAWRKAKTWASERNKDIIFNLYHPQSCRMHMMFNLILCFWMRMLLRNALVSLYTSSLPKVQIAIQ